MLLVTGLESGKLTNRYHTLRVVVKIFQHHLAKRVDLTSTSHPKTANTIISPVVRTSTSIVIPNPLFLPTQEPSLLLQAPQQPPQLPHHLAIARPITLILPKHNREVEYKLIPTVFPLANTDRIANDAVVVNAEGEEPVAELLGWDEKLRYRGERKQRRGERGGQGGGRDRARGDLVEDAVS